MFVIRHWVERLRSHVLFIPALITALLLGVAYLLVELERRLALAADHLPGIFFTGGPEAAWQILSTIATSVATLTGVTFSVTIVALALRAQQFGPRLLRNFTRNTLNQIVLGVFVGTFAYSVIVLRLVRSEDPEYVPYLAVSGAVALALSCLALFVVFIDRIVDSIQATTVVAEAAGETRVGIAKRFRDPNDGGSERPGMARVQMAGAVPADDAVERGEGEDAAMAVVAGATGYIQAVDVERLVEIATDAEARIDLELGVGGFVGDRTVIMRVRPVERVGDEIPAQIRKAVTIGSHRSIAQDPAFGVRQIVDVAVLALSTGVNDPTTAVTALDHLGALLAEVAVRDPVPDRHHDERGRIRVTTREPSFLTLTELAFNEVRRSGEADLAVTVRMVEVIAELGTLVVRAADREALEHQLWALARGAERGMRDPADVERVNRVLRMAMEVLGRGDLPVQPLAKIPAGPGV